MISLWTDLQVQIGPVDHESWWAHNSGSIAVAIAAVVAAGLAAYVSIKNRREELAQNRELNERDHIRNTLDSVLEQIDRIMAANTSVYSRLAARDAIESEDARKEWDSEIREHLSVAQNEEIAMRGRQVQLELRFGLDHPIASSHKELLDELSDWLSWMGRSLRSADPIDTAVGVESMKSIGKTFRRFRTECRKWFSQSPTKKSWRRLIGSFRKTAAS
jgi:hypothetical protein